MALASGQYLIVCSVLKFFSSLLVLWNPFDFWVTYPDGDTSESEDLYSLKQSIDFFLEQISFTFMILIFLPFFFPSLLSVVFKYTKIHNSKAIMLKRKPLQSWTGSPHGTAKYSIWVIMLRLMIFCTTNYVYFALHRLF